MLAIKNSRGVIRVCFAFIAITYLGFTSCNIAINEEKSIPIYNKDSVKIGDSIIENYKIKKIVFIDNLSVVDSITFQWNDDYATLKSYETFVKGRRTFENRYYDERGLIKKYLFYSSDDSTCFYECEYGENGKVLKSNNKLFLEIYLDGLDKNSLKIPENKDLRIEVFHPKPPNCLTELFVLFDSSQRRDVFEFDPNIECLETTSTTATKKSVKWSLVEVECDITCDTGQTIFTTKPIYFEVY